MTAVDSSQRIGGEFEHGLTQHGLVEQLFARPEDTAAHLLHPDRSGDKLVVPSEVRQITQPGAPLKRRPSAVPAASERPWPRLPVANAISGNARAGG